MRGTRRYGTFSRSPASHFPGIGCPALMSVEQWVLTLPLYGFASVSADSGGVTRFLSIQRQFLQFTSR
jgi:hypothetical protein